MSRYNQQPDTLAGAFESMRADYNAAKITRFRKRLVGVNPMGSGADYHYRSEADFLRIMEWARNTDRNDVVVGQGVTRLVNNVLQQGVNLDPRTDDPKLNLYIANKWAAWAEDEDRCSLSGEMTLHQIAEMALRATIVDGDCFVLPILGGTLQPIEAHRCRTPNNTTRNVVHGILMDDNRKRLQYWFTKEDVGINASLQRVSDVTQYDARDSDGYRQVLHIYNPRRFSQTRGVSALAPILDAVGMHDDIQFAKLVQQQIVSCFAILREREHLFKGGNVTPTGAQTTETQSDGSTRILEGIAPGMSVAGMPGEKLTGFSPNVPNAEFFDHALLILTFIAINLQLPLAVLLLDPSKTNFSGWRGAMDQARGGFLSIHKYMVSRFYKPVYLWKLREWMQSDPKVREGAARLGSDIFWHRFSQPYWPYIEPEKDARGDAAIISNRLNSRRQVLARRGLDIDDVDAEIIEDNTRLIKAAIETAGKLKSETGEDVSWRDVLNLAEVEPVQFPTSTKEDTQNGNGQPEN